MSTIHILGGTGYSGAAIARAAIARGHDVTAISRTLPADPLDGVRYHAADPLDGVRYHAADLTDPAAREDALAGADVVVGALSPRGDMVGALPDLYSAVADLAARSGARVVVIGGYGSLRPAPDAPRIFEDEHFPAEYVEESRELGRVLDVLRDHAAVEWLYLSPAMIYGAYAPGAATGRYRTGGEIALTNPDGSPTAISGVDFAAAVVDEIESGAHSRAHLSYAE